MDRVHLYNNSYISIMNPCKTTLYSFYALSLVYTISHLQQSKSNQEIQFIMNNKLVYN